MPSVKSSLHSEKHVGLKKNGSPCRASVTAAAVGEPKRRMMTAKGWMAGLDRGARTSSCQRVGHSPSRLPVDGLFFTVAIDYMNELLLERDTLMGRLEVARGALPADHPLLQRPPDAPPSLWERRWNGGEFKEGEDDDEDEDED